MYLDAAIFESCLTRVIFTAPARFPGSGLTNAFCRCSLLVSVPVEPLSGSSLSFLQPKNKVRMTYPMKVLQAKHVAAAAHKAKIDATKIPEQHLTPPPPPLKFSASPDPKSQTRASVRAHAPSYFAGSKMSERTLDQSDGRSGCEVNVVDGSVVVGYGYVAHGIRFAGRQESDQSADASPARPPRTLSCPPALAVPLGSPLSRMGVVTLQRAEGDAYSSDSNHEEHDDSDRDATSYEPVPVARNRGIPRFSPWYASRS